MTSQLDRIEAMLIELAREVKELARLYRDEAVTSGPGNEREEVSGLSTKGQNKNIDGGTGYDGG